MEDTGQPNALSTANWDIKHTYHESAGELNQISDITLALVMAATNLALTLGKTLSLTHTIAIPRPDDGINYQSSQGTVVSQPLYRNITVMPSLQPNPKLWRALL